MFLIGSLWRCPKCGRVTWDPWLELSAFCKRCGAPRPRGRGVVVLTFAGKPGIADGTTKRVREILTAEHMADALPSGTRANVLVIGPVAEGTTLAEAHGIWRREYFPEAAGLPPYPKQPVEAIVPRDVVRVEIQAVEHTSGGMSSQFGFVGLFVSVLVSLGTTSIWDVRATDAT